MSDTKYLLVKGRAGLGNRLQSLLTGILYARLSGRRLLVDWSDGTYADRGVNAFPRLFQCPLYDPTVPIPETDSVSPAVWRGCLGLSSLELQRRCQPPGSPNDWQRYSIDLGKLDYPETVVVFYTFAQKIHLLRPHFPAGRPAMARMEVDDILRELLRDELFLSGEIGRRIDEFARSHFQPPTIGVHVRYSDRRVDLLLIRRKLDALTRRRPDQQIFLATDNSEIKRVFEAEYRNVITTPKWYADPGRPMHGASPDRVESAIEALVDLHLLARCDRLVLDSRSTFAYLVKLLTLTPASRVADVRHGTFATRVRRLPGRVWSKLRSFAGRRLSSWANRAPSG